MPDGFQKPPPGHDLIYGTIWPKGAPLLPLELTCYRENRQPKDGGLGAHAHFKNAWKLVWPKFDWNDWSKIICEAWCSYSRISIMGHGAAGKTYNLAFCAYLDWLAQPFETMTSLTTVTADGLRLRMWGDLMRAHEIIPPEIRRMLKVYSSSNRMTVMFDLEAAGGEKTHEFDKYIIEGMATSRTADASGRIRGKHAPRRRLILDEADDMADVIYETFANVRTDPDVKIVDMSNAMDRYSNFGKACEPKAGWQSIHDTDLFWETKGGGVCIHLDGLQNPNCKAGLIDGKKKYPYMLGPSEIEEIRKQNGEDSKEWWCFVRGFFPPDGIVSKVWPSAAIERARQVLPFDFAPEPCAALDPAFSYDDCVLHRGEKGKLRDGRTAINGVQSVKITVKQGAGLEPEDYQVAHEVMRLCKEWGVQPTNFIQDKTGNARGVYAVLQKEWSVDVVGINYGGEATERPLRAGQLDKACDIVRYYVSELWFRASYLAYDGLLGGLDRLHKKTLDDLNVRRYETRQFTKGKLMQVETKDDLKKRLGRSPDNGDAFSQFSELLVRDFALAQAKDKNLPVSQKWKAQQERAKKAASLYEREFVDVDSW
jgi:hypothetical protein